MQLWKTSQYNKNSARYYHKCTQVFKRSTRSSCQIVVKLEFSRNITEENFEYRMSWQSVQREPTCSLSTGTHTNMHACGTHARTHTHTYIHTYIHTTQQVDTTGFCYVFQISRQKFFGHWTYGPSLTPVTVFPFMQVSVVLRIVPSPDWFVGLDSLQLCKNGFWIDALSVQVRRTRRSCLFHMLRCSRNNKLIPWCIQLTTHFWIKSHKSWP
jgi:hypothetical protein